MKDSVRHYNQHIVLNVTKSLTSTINYLKSWLQPWFLQQFVFVYNIVHHWLNSASIFYCS